VQALLDRLIVGEPFADPQPFMGPVIDEAAAANVEKQWQVLALKGGKPLRNLERPVDGRPFLTPALIDVTDAEDRPDEEIFGPVLQVIRVKDFDAAIEEANNTRFGLAASLVGGTPDQFHKFWAQVRAGVINWNKPTNGAPSNAPFGGVGLSGNHRPSAFSAADYCAYPVTSSEADRPRAAIDHGLRDPNMLED
jgi:succinylglutamic semialdehyde dehydrogenase